MPTIEERLRRLKDEAAIRDLATRFADTCIRADYVGFRALWTPDATWAIAEPFPVVCTGIDAITDLVRALRVGRDFFVQFIPSGVIELADDHATARCPVREVAKGPGEIYYDNFTLYEDVIRKVAGHWLFVSRSYRYLYLNTASFTGSTYPLPLLTEEI